MATLSDKEIIKKVREIIKNEMHECSCTDGNFTYGCRHTVRRLMEILTPPNKSIQGDTKVKIKKLNMFTLTHHVKTTHPKY